MSDGSLVYEIREQPKERVGEGLVLELFVEGERVAIARASRETLEQMSQLLGMQRVAVAAELEKSLRAHLKSRLQKVPHLSKPVEDPSTPLRFISHYTYRRDRDEHDEGVVLEEGVVCYDVSAGEVGPESVPEIVRSRMRTEVHKHLTADTKKTRELIELLE